MDLCQSCLEGYYVNTQNDRDFCLPKIQVNAYLEIVKNPKLFKLRFTEDWVELFETFNKTLVVTIDTLDKSSFSYTIYPTGKKWEFYIQNNYSAKVAVNSKLSVTISPNYFSSRSKFFNLIDRFLSCFLDEYIPCAKLKYWSWGKNNNIK